jgi:hypothetical protein
MGTDHNRSLIQGSGGASLYPLKKSIRSLSKQTEPKAKHSQPSRIKNMQGVQKLFHLGKNSRSVTHQHLEVKERVTPHTA